MRFLRRYQLQATAGLTAAQELEISEEEIPNGNGIAAGTSVVQFRGLSAVYAVQLIYSGASITTVTRITDTYSGGLVLEVTGNTDAIYYVVTPAAKSSGGGASTKTEVHPVGERLQLNVSLADPNATVKALIIAG